MSYFDQKKLRAEIVQATAFVRNMLERYNCDSRFTLKLIVEGSADRADAKMRFNFDVAGYYGTSVESPQLSDAVSELMRRMGFDKVHQAELLTYDADKEAEIERLQRPRPANWIGDWPPTPAPPAATE